MKKINNCIVFSDDIERILKGNNALDFNYEEKGMLFPNTNFIDCLRKDFKKDVDKIFDNKTLIISENEMLESLLESIKDIYGGIPIVSLDKIYSEVDFKNIYFLDCTRMDNSNELISRNNPNDLKNVDNQIAALSKMFLDQGINQIILFDDVVFSGSVLRKIIEKFKFNNIEVIGIRACISTIESYNYFNTILPLGLKSGYILYDNVIDQICERDFYFGIAQSGISIIDDNNKIYKAPYFKPYGNPVDRASIPQEYEIEFSNSCIERSIALWQEINKNSNKEFYIYDLPEEIYLANKEDSVINTLKRSLEK